MPNIKRKFIKTTDYHRQGRRLLELAVLMEKLAHNIALQGLIEQSKEIWDVAKKQRRIANDIIKSKDGMGNNGQPAKGTDDIGLGAGDDVRAGEGSGDRDPAGG